VIKLDRRIAVVSDIHIGEHARSSDLCPVGRNQKMQQGQFLDKFEAFISKSAIQADSLIVSGDITSQARPDEFELASILVRRWGESLGRERRRHIFRSRAIMMSTGQF